MPTFVSALNPDKALTCDSAFDNDDDLWLGFEGLGRFAAGAHFHRHEVAALRDHLSAVLGDDSDPDPETVEPATTAGTVTLKLAFDTRELVSQLAVLQDAVNTMNVRPQAEAA